MGLTPSGDRKQILFIARKKDAQPVLGQLRQYGHQVSLVEDLDEAQALLASGSFIYTVVAGHALAGLLEQRSAWESADTEGWRRSISGLTFDLQNVLGSLHRTMDVSEDANLQALAELRQTISILGAYLEELTNELAACEDNDIRLSIVDLEDVIETAAMTVYRSASERRQRLVIDLEREVARLRADGVKLKRMLSALLDYASGQTPPLGNVTVHAYLESGDPVLCISFSGEETSRPELNRLFSRRREHAPWAPLSRVQALAEQLECRLWLESEQALGTSVFLSFPAWSHIGAGHAPSPIRN